MDWKNLQGGENLDKILKLADARNFASGAPGAIDSTQRGCISL